MLTLHLLVWLSLVIVPLFFMVWLVVGRFPTRTDFTIHLMLTGSYIGWMVLAGRWDWFSVHARWPMLVLMHLAFVLAFRRRRKSPPPALPVTGSVWLGRVILGLAAAWFTIQGGSTLFGHAETERAVSLDLPFNEGRFYIGQGGATAAVNQHNGHPAQNFGLDINQLNRFGNRANAMIASEASDHVIWGTSVISPCDGQVIAAQGRHPDQEVGEQDRENLAGNHVWLRCKWVDVLLAHLMQDSLAVEVGQNVRRGDTIGRVGNSGNTTSPHLHMHAQRQADPPDFNRGRAVPIRIEGKVPVRGQMFTAGLGKSTDRHGE